jgi:capsid protein
VSFWTRIFGSDRREQNRIANRRAYARREHAFRNAVVSAASPSKSSVAWAGSSDDFNQDTLSAIDTTMKRAQDLDVNNPDVRGFHRTRVAQVVGKGVTFKSAPHPSEVGLTPDEATAVSQQINRLRKIHSRMGGFDSTGHRYTENKQQERAFLTAFITGCCLIHRVGNPDPKAILPFSLELIPGSRISTPYDKSGDPTVSFGVQYTDEHRSRVKGYWVRRVPMTRGNSFIPEYRWDLVGVEDCELLPLTEMAGLDRSLPLGVAVVRMLRNRGEFIESSVQSARAQAKISAAIECADGVDPWNAADDDRDEAVSAGAPLGFMTLGDAQIMYLSKGEKINWNAAKLPDPDFPGFMKVTDARCARGFSASLSRFTREVNNSWAGGRLEDQQDDPIIDQYRETFCAAWQRVNEWFLDAVWLSGAVELPGYSNATRPFWTEFRAEFPGKVHINPVDTANARRIGYELRTLTPQQACEEDGKDLRENLRQWAEALKLARDTVKEFKLEEGDLEFLLEGIVVSSSMTTEDAKNVDPAQKTKNAMNRMREFLNMAGVSDG